jgi:4-aminobutyrate aminotransferase-like enzyme
MAVLEEIQQRKLQANAAKIGALAAKALTGLASKHGVIGDVRQSGMVFGVEFLKDKATLEPASGFADQVVEAMRERGVLLSKLGRHKNTLKIRPPMTFSEEHLGLLVQTLDEVLAELAPQS